MSSAAAWQPWTRTRVQQERSRWVSTRNTCISTPWREPVRVAKVSSEPRVGERWPEPEWTSLGAKQKKGEVRRAAAASAVPPHPFPIGILGSTPGSGKSQGTSRRAGCDQGGPVPGDTGTDPAPQPTWLPPAGSCGRGRPRRPGSRARHHTAAGPSLSLPSAPAATAAARRPDAP